MTKNSILSKTFIYSLTLTVAGFLIAPLNAQATTVNLDFSSGTFFDRPTGTGLDFYTQDGFTVEIANTTHNTAMNTCPTRWCFDNNYTTPAETTLITRDDGGVFDLDSIQILATHSSFGLNFSADGGAVQNVNSIGTAFFGPEFQGITVLQISIPCSGQFVSCGATIDNVNLTVGAVPIPAAVWLFGSGLLGLIGVASRKNA